MSEPEPRKEFRVDADLTLHGLEVQDLDAVPVVGPKSEVKDDYLEELNARAVEILRPQDRNDKLYTEALVAHLDEDKKKELGDSAPNARTLRKFVLRKLESIRADAISEARWKISRLELVLQEIFSRKSSPIIARRDREIQVAEAELRERIREIHDRYDEELRPHVDAARDIRHTLAEVLDRQIRDIDQAHKRASHQVHEDRRRLGRV